MVTAFVLIKTQPGHERDVYYSLARQQAFAELHPVIGQYNLVVKVISESIEKIGYIVVDQINKTKNVSYTETLTAMEF
jgi:DNA-binding Lrp family transcriptional regulator